MPLSHLVSHFGPKVYPAASGEFHWAARRSDCAVACGGGYLHGSYPLGLHLHLHQIHLASAHDLPVYLYSQSIGPADGLHRRAIDRALKKSRRIYVREKISREFVEDLGVARPLSVAPDAAFNLAPLKTSESQAKVRWMEKEERPWCGFTVRRWHFPGKSNPKSLYRRYLSSFAALIDANTDVTFFYIPQVTGPENRDDMEAVHDLFRVAGWSEAPSNLRIMNDKLSARELIHIISHLDSFVGTRMHSNIFALIAEVPTVAISYLPKTQAIMNMLGLDEWVLSIESITADALKDRFRSLRKQESEYRDHLSHTCPEIAEDSRLPAREILEDLS